jgi:hypothetical protein
MKIVIGRGSNRHVFERPVDKAERQAMSNYIKRILFKK